jgi:hypothetical protein
MISNYVPQSYVLLIRGFWVVIKINQFGSCRLVSLSLFVDKRNRIFRKSVACLYPSLTDTLCPHKAARITTIVRNAARGPVSLLLNPDVSPTCAACFAVDLERVRRALNAQDP